MKIVVAITGASGAILGVRLLTALNELENIETHLVISDWGKKTIEIETDFALEDVIKKSHYYHDNKNLGASIASGSFKTDCMVIIPCSMKTLSGISHGYSNSLITRAADVMLKERRKLIIVPRETPLNTIHLENLLKLSKMGVEIAPFLPAFYNSPKSLDDVLDHFIGRVLDQLGIENKLVKRWGENQNN